MQKLVLVLALSLILVGCTSTGVDINTRYSLSDVSKHTQAADCWMIINGKVYDVTSFIPRHPGGNEILQGCGKDASVLFNTQDGQGGHSNEAKDQLAPLQIGVLAN